LKRPTQEIPLESLTRVRFASPATAIGLLIAFALTTRLALLAAVALATGQTEFADDFRYYSFFMDHPWALITGRGLDEVPEAVIYSPLIPAQVWFPAALLRDWLGIFMAQRLGMVLYDVAALAVTLWAITRMHPPGVWRRRDWTGALLLMAIPGSLAASALWGQEDTIAALWTAFALAALVSGHPTVSALFGAFGLFTHKLFALLLSLGIWGACAGARWKIVLTSGGVVGAFAAFLLARWYWGGVSPTSYAYNAIYNSPSPWALAERLTGTRLSFDHIRLVVLVTTAAALALVTLLLWRRPTTPEASVVATHATFFVVFLGIQPEHHQWFLPFLIYFAWRCWQRRDYVSFAVAWSFSGLAYGYKVAYGLQMRASGPSEGKMIFKEWAGTLVDLLPAFQVAFHIATILCGIALVWRAVHTKPATE
jgi:hypothetical protein